MTHQRKAFRALLTATLGLTVFLSGSGSSLAQPGKDLKGTSLAAESVHHIAALKSRGSEKVGVIVQLEDAPLASYTGGVTGLAATSPKATGAATLDVRSADSQAYLGHLARKQNDFEDSARRAVSNPQVTHRLDVVVNAVSMVVQADQVENLARVQGVKAILPDELLKLDTDRSPAFIGATDLWEELGGQANAGEGVIVGVLDTGIWPEHPSLSDVNPFGGPYPAPPPPRSGTRICQFSGGTNPGPAFTCNNKLIGAARFMSTYDQVVGLVPGEYTTARDDDGHGTHTSTTAAGNGRVQASIFGVDRGQVSGIAPRAHVIMYKVCGESGCFSSDSAAAVQQAINDGVNVINFSISGGRDPFTDTVELAFLDAYNAGVFVAAAAGNAGPTPDSTDHRGPWVTTVAASTHNRAFTSTATLRASNGDTLRLTGTTLTGGITAATPIELPNQATAATRLCGDVPNKNPFDTINKPFAGKIVVCERGVTGRVEKGFNVSRAGAVGMLLRNPVVQDQETDNHFIPTVHLDKPEGDQLLTFLGSHSGVTATFPAGAASRSQGDVMAAFSSRGGPGQSLGISKPDVTAPGVQILAGHSPQHIGIAGGPNGELFQAIAGTSMSSPQVAGAAALLKNSHPTWSPGEIKSALMTTAKSRVVKEDGRTPTTPFDDGSGRIDLSEESSADDPGITFSETGAGFLTKQNELWNANYPSIYVPRMPGIVTMDRTAHSQLTRNSRWDLRISEKPRDLQITVPDRIDVPARGDATFEIVIDARNVPIGEVRHSQIELRSGSRVLHMPVTIVRRQAVAELTKTCSPGTFARGATSVCEISATNTSFEPAAVTITDTLPNRLELVPGSVKGASQIGNSLSFKGVLAGARPPNVTIASAPGSSPAGYLPLSTIGIAPIAGLGDESIANLNVPAFTFAGQSYTSLGVVSNGYVVVGGGGSGDIQFVNQNLPNPARPNNTLAPFWTDLDLTKGGAVRVGVLTDGADTWIVVDFAGVPEFGTTTTNSFEIWIGVDGDAHPGEDITYTYGTLQGKGSEGLLTVGAENVSGNRGQNVYFNGVGTLPTSATELRVTGTAGAPGESHKITFTMRGVRSGAWTNYAMLTSNLFEGISVAMFGGEVTR